MTVRQYFAALQGKRVVVLGLGVSNLPLMQLLLDYGCTVTGCDKTPLEHLPEEVRQDSAVLQGKSQPVRRC